MKPLLSRNSCVWVALAVAAVCPAPWHVLPLLVAGAGVCRMTRRKTAPPPADETRLLLEISQSVGSTLRLDVALKAVDRGLRGVVRFDTIVLYSLDGGMLRPEASRGAGQGAFAPLDLRLGEGPVGRSAQAGLPVRHFDGVQCVLALPLRLGPDTIGVLAFYSQAADAFLEDRMRILIAAAATLAGALDNVRRYREAEESAGIDFLTELPNARALDRHLHAAVEDCTRLLEPLVVMVGDLDGFKAVNDQLGHAAGNQLLQQVAAALKSQCRGADFVARMGGDEFAFVLRGAPLLSTLEIQARFAHAAEHAGHSLRPDLRVRLSLGLARLGMDGETPQQLLEAADRRMYQAKAATRSRAPQPQQRDLRGSPQPHRDADRSDAPRHVQG